MNKEDALALKRVAELIQNEELPKEDVAQIIESITATTNHRMKSIFAHDQALAELQQYEGKILMLMCDPIFRESEAGQTLAKALAAYVLGAIRFKRADAENPFVED